MAQVAQPFGDYVEHAAGCALGHLLCHACDDDAVLHAHFTIVGAQFAGDQLHQGGFAFAVATDDAYALVRLDRKIDMLEQEGAADTEVDALKLDQGHPPIVAANGRGSPGSAKCLKPLGRQRRGRRAYVFISVTAFTPPLMRRMMPFLPRSGMRSESVV